jgi:hypothetical protein
MAGYTVKVVTTRVVTVFADTPDAAVRFAKEGQGFCLLGPESEVMLIAGPNVDWVEWAGGDMPMEPGTLVDVRHRDGEVYTRVPAGSIYCEDWSRNDDNPYDGDIMAYRICEQDEG